MWIPARPDWPVPRRRCARSRDLVPADVLPRRGPSGRRSCLAGGRTPHRRRPPDASGNTLGDHGAGATGAREIGGPDNVQYFRITPHEQGWLHVGSVGGAQATGRLAAFVAGPESGTDSWLVPSRSTGVGPGKDGFMLSAPVVSRRPYFLAVLGDGTAAGAYELIVALEQGRPRGDSPEPAVPPEVGSMTRDGYPRRGTVPRRGGLRHARSGVFARLGGRAGGAAGCARHSGGRGRRQRRRLQLRAVGPDRQCPLSARQRRGQRAPWRL